MDEIINNINIKSNKIEVPEKTKRQWQQLLNIVIDFSGAQDALLNRFKKPYLQIIQASKNEKNIFNAGDAFKLAGHYCQRVIESQNSLEVQNAEKELEWQQAPELEFGLISYLGFPLKWPNGDAYGTICIHDSQERQFSNEIKTRLELIRDLVEDHLNIIYQNNLNYNLRTYYSKLIDILPIGVMIENKEGLILKVNKVMEEITGFSKENLIGRTIFETIVPDGQQETARQNIDKILAGDILIHELPSENKNGEKSYIRLQERKIALPNDTTGIISIQSDITDKIENEEKIKYASYHDSLTSLYNRSYLEKKIQQLDSGTNLPIGVIMADLNGLKLINDTYGHYEGDLLLKKMAQILEQSCRGDDIIARWGGDEYVILLPETNKKAVKKVVQRINKKISNEFLEFDDGTKLPLSAALGYGVKKHYYQDIFDILAAAENEMYKNKLTESRSIKSNILNTLLKTLSEKSQETTSHSNRMAELAQKIAEKINLSKSQQNQLNLIARLHDIGKTVVPESILNKKGELTEAEWKEIKDHPAVGHRILNATEEFSHISDAVLSHHEKWNGSGYPRGLEEKEIPLLSRIIALVDSYDVMTTNQVYKAAVSKEEALAEIKVKAGIQFDPELAEIFIELMSD